jgi:hypothetical protein
VVTAFVREDSAVFALAVEQYVRHGVPAFADRCSVCRESGCPVRRHAAEVIQAAGVDPRRYDPPPRRTVAVGRASAPTRLLPTSTAARAVYGGGAR